MKIFRNLYKLKLFLITLFVYIPFFNAYSSTTCKHIVKNLIRNTSGPYSKAFIKINDPFVSYLLTDGLMVANIGLRFHNGISSMEQVAALTNASLSDELILPLLESNGLPALYSIEDKSLVIDEIALELLSDLNSKLGIGVSSLLTKGSSGRNYQDLLLSIASRIREQVLFETGNDANNPVLPKMYSKIEIPRLSENSDISPTLAINYLRAYNLYTAIATMGTLSVYLTTSATYAAITRPEIILQAFYLLVYALERATDPSYEVYGEEASILATAMANLKELFKSGKAGNEFSFGVYTGLSKVIPKMHASILYLYGKTDPNIRQHNLVLFQETVVKLQFLSQRTGFKTDTEAGPLKNHPIQWLEQNSTNAAIPNLSDLAGKVSLRKF